jgi:protein-S-isoprenylcysteine O-methyltransferase Ste14
MKWLSMLGFLLMAGGALALVITHSLFSFNPAVIIAQAAAAGLMAWARFTFGFRSFHAAANPTRGGLVTSGPYAFMRHPIYAAVCLFVIAGGLANLTWLTAVLILSVLIGSLIRIHIEERLLIKQYPEYAEYAARTKRMVPYVF